MADGEDKDVAMEEGGEMDEDELLGTEGKNGEEEGQGDNMKEEATVDGEDKEKTEEEKKDDDEEQYDDGGAASDVEFTTEDSRVPASENVWKWHIEMYPLAPEDVTLDNFVKMVSTASSSHVVFRDNERGEKRGEAHFYTHDMEVARTLMRTICCRKFTFFRPFVYLYHLKDGSEDQYETAYIRLDLIESAKMRWDKQKKNKGDATTRVARVSDVPLDTSKEFLKVLFARAYLVKRESDQSEEEAKKAKEPKAKEEPKAESSSAEKSEEKEEEEENEEEEEELVGEFNGNLTIDCSSRASLRGFLLGYRKITIGSSLLDIKPLAEDIDIDALRKEVRKKRCFETIHGKEWKPVTAADRVSKRDEDMEDRGWRGDRGRGRGSRGGGGRGGGGSSSGGGSVGGGGRGGVMTGRQKMNEKSMKRGWVAGGGGGRDDRRRGGGGGGGGFADDVRYLQSQLAMNTYELQRQIATLRGRDRGFYDMGPMGGGGYGGGYGRDDWGGGYSGGQGGGRYGGGGGGGGRGGGRKQRGGGGGGGGWR